MFVSRASDYNDLVRSYLMERSFNNVEEYL